MAMFTSSAELVVPDPQTAVEPQTGVEPQTVVESETAVDPQTSIDPHVAVLVIIVWYLDKRIALTEPFYLLIENKELN